jgi:hypothetical protein
MAPPYPRRTTVVGAERVVVALTEMCRTRGASKSAGFPALFTGPTTGQRRRERDFRVIRGQNPRHPDCVAIRNVFR